MFFGGIYRESKDVDSKPEVSIITTAANETMGQIYHRMPVILSPGNEAMAWIQEFAKDSLDELMRSASNDLLALTPVTDYVKKLSNEGPKCIDATT